MATDDNNRLELSVYLADDDKDDQDLFKTALSEINPNIKLRLFSRGKDLIAAMNSETQRPDLIFLDLYMPIMDGESCLKEIKTNLKQKHIPVIIYSSEFDLDRIEDLFELGADGYLKKPFSYDDLITSLEKILPPSNTYGKDDFFKRQIVA